MEIKEIGAYSQKIKGQADTILEETGLIKILSEFGTPHVVGSYAMDLMYDPNLDIIVTSKDIRNSSVQALQRIIEKRICQKLEYGDFVKFKREKRPEGYIIVLKIAVDGIKWEVEIWFLPSATKEEKDVRDILSTMTSEQKDRILEFKHLLNKNSITKYSISSSKIYEAVIDKNMKEFDVFVRMYS
jgi:hypothetical protein